MDIPLITLLIADPGTQTTTVVVGTVVVVLVQTVVVASSVAYIGFFMARRRSALHYCLRSTVFIAYEYIS